MKRLAKLGLGLVVTIGLAGIALAADSTSTSVTGNLEDAYCYGTMGAKGAGFLRLGNFLRFEVNFIADLLHCGNQLPDSGLRRIERDRSCPGREVDARLADAWRVRKLPLNGAGARGARHPADRQLDFFRLFHALA